LRHALLSCGSNLFEPMGSGCHDQLAGTIFIDTAYVEQIIN
jgi:hypothetical protein